MSTVSDVSGWTYQDWIRRLTEEGMNPRPVLDYGSRSDCPGGCMGNVCLSVVQRPDEEQVRVKCFAGCTAEEVGAALRGA